MRVVQVLPKFTSQVWGGAESAALELARCLPHVEVWACRLPGDAASESLDGVPVRRFRSFYPGGRSAIGDGRAGIPPGLMYELARLPSRESVVHVHCHNRLSATVVTVCHAKQIPVVLTLHSRVLDLRPRWRYWVPNLLPIRAADAVVAVSDAVAASARTAAGRAEILVVPNGIDTRWVAAGDRKRGRQNLGVDESLPLVSFIGRISRIKNLEVLLDAVRHACEGGTELGLAIAGPPADGTYAWELRTAVAADRVLAQRVKFVGPLGYASRPLADLFAASDLVVLPSAYEAHGLVVLEAWAAGCGVVVADVGGMGPLVRQAGVGRVWDPVSGSPGLAAELLAALSSVRTDHRLPERARAAAARYSADRMAERYEEIYEQLIANREPVA